MGGMVSRAVVAVQVGGPSCAAVGGSSASGVSPRVGQQHHPLTGGWWGARGGRRLVGRVLRAWLSGGFPPLPRHRGWRHPAFPFGCGCRPPDPARPLPTAGCADRSTSVRHAGRNVWSQLGDIGTPARRDLLDDRDDQTKPMTTPGWLVLGPRAELICAGVPGVYSRQ